MQSQKTKDNSEDSSQQENIEELKKRVTFNNTELRKLVTNSESFAERIKKLNNKAVKEIKGECFDEAIVYLEEAERGLEYAANCALSIDRTLITTTLLNLACSHQRLWDLAVCYNYKEAFLSNLQESLKYAQPLEFTSNLKDKTSSQYINLCRTLKIKQGIAVSFLRFSALSSQLENHIEAKSSVNKALSQLKQICDILHEYQLQVKGKTSLLLKRLKENISFDQEESEQKLLKEAKRGLQNINDHVHFFSFASEDIQNLSMGDVMQIGFATVDKQNQVPQADAFINQLGLIHLSIYVSCCYFAFATEIRLISQQNISQNGEQGLKIAKLYHLHSIKLASQLVLIESAYLKHIIKSFKNNFQIDLYSYQIKESPIQSFIQIVPKTDKQSQIKDKHFLQKNSYSKIQPQNYQNEDEVKNSQMKENHHHFQNDLKSEKVEEKRKKDEKLKIKTEVSRKISVISPTYSPRNNVLKSNKTPIYYLRESKQQQKRKGKSKTKQSVKSKSKPKLIKPKKNQEDKKTNSRSKSDFEYFGSPKSKPNQTTRSRSKDSLLAKSSKFQIRQFSKSKNQIKQEFSSEDE